MRACHALCTLLAALLLGACTFTRTAEVARADALQVAPHVVVTDEAGSEHDAEVLSVEPIAARNELPTYYPEAGKAPLFARAATQQEIAATWDRDPSWERAEVKFQVAEPAGATVVVIGAVAGAIGAGLTTYYLVRCGDEVTASCGDVEGLRWIAVSGAFTLGGVLGGVTGGAAHQLFGGDRYQIAAP